MLGGAELGAHLLRGEPLVITRRGRVLLVGKQLLEGGLDCGRAGKPEEQRHALAVGQGAAVGGGYGPGGAVAGERAALGKAGGLGDAIGPKVRGGGGKHRLLGSCRQRQQREGDQDGSKTNISKAGEEARRTHISVWKIRAGEHDGKP